jgi:hypothetical protein
MDRRSFFTTVASGVAGLLVAAPAVCAERYDDRYWAFPYRDYNDPWERRRRAGVYHRMVDLADRVRHAERAGDITPREAGKLYDRLERVRDFLRHDHYLDPVEFDRRMHDLDRADDDLGHYVHHRD